PRICVVESRQTTPMRGRVTPDHFLIAILPRICVPSYAYAWEPYLHEGFVSETAVPIELTELLYSHL
ncbi:hypothetical protein PIB30_105238, partial [Stylosanthes scabra]|nr:hypothetical protein [Stylosanthes scabra]